MPVTIGGARLDKTLPLMNTTASPSKRITMAVIETENLTRSYKGQVAVDGLNLQVEAGCIFGLIGSNGAGKTTTVRMLTTLLNPSAGTARVAGFDTQKQSQQVRRNIGYVPQTAQTDEALTGREHLTLQGRLYGMEKREMIRRIEEVLELVDLKSAADTRTLEYSGGMRKLLDIATGLLHLPKVLFLDEPTSGVDVAHRQHLLDYIQTLPALGMTVFLTSHFLEEVDQLAHQVAILNHGKILIEGAPAKLKAGIGSAVLDITFRADKIRDIQDVVLKLRQKAGLIRLITNGNRLKIFTIREDDILSELRKDLDGSAASTSSLTIAQPTLDDVFFYHVGQEVN